MKHSDFLATLKDLKRHYQKQRVKKPTFYVDKTKQQTYCTCKDSQDESKYLYTSQKEIEYLLSSKSIKLLSYPCPYEKGWHLTKN